MVDALLWSLTIGATLVLLWLLAVTAGGVQRGGRPSEPMRKGRPPQIGEDQNA